jgi:hypothetical protein
MLHHKTQVPTDQKAASHSKSFWRHRRRTLSRHTVSAYSKAEFHWKDFCWPYIDTESACQKPSRALPVRMLCKQISIKLAALLLSSGLVWQHLGSLLRQSIYKKVWLLLLLQNKLERRKLICCYKQHVSILIIKTIWNQTAQETGLQPKMRTI